ncbi:hypothetical protein [Halorubrum sp. BV1]|uniref:hypothetical protein n=1 Tax=Halorubrum sp. BV1 TaxID=1498500 RepID=UPI0006788C84|nr:hypothetical protein [Halorubrum sp. BV1]
MSHSEIEQHPIRHSLGLSRDLAIGTVKTFVDALFGVCFLYVGIDFVESFVRVEISALFVDLVANPEFFYFVLISVFIWRIMVETIEESDSAQSDDQEDLNDIIGKFGTSKKFGKIYRGAMFMVMNDLYKGVACGSGAAFAILSAGNIPTGLAVLPVVFVPAVEVALVKSGRQGPMFVIAYLTLLPLIFPIFFTALVVYSIRRTPDAMFKAWEIVVAPFTAILQYPYRERSTLDTLGSLLNRRRLG